MQTCEICFHWSIVGSTPVGLCAQACKTITDSGVAAYIEFNFNLSDSKEKEGRGKKEKEDEERRGKGKTFKSSRSPLMSRPTVLGS